VLELDRVADRVGLDRPERVGVDLPGLEVGSGMQMLRNRPGESQAD
jgi:hypothetical protein